MIGDYLTDRVDIITVAADAWGGQNASTQADVPARVEDKNATVLDANGKEVAANVHVVLGPGAAVGHNSRLVIRSRAGVVAELPLKAWPVKSFGRGHAFGLMTTEVWL